MLLSVMDDVDEFYEYGPGVPSFQGLFVYQSHGYDTEVSDSGVVILDSHNTGTDVLHEQSNETTQGLVTSEEMDALVATKINVVAVDTMHINATRA